MTIVNIKSGQIIGFASDYSEAFARIRQHANYFVLTREIIDQLHEKRITIKSLK